MKYVSHTVRLRNVLITQAYKLHNKYLQFVTEQKLFLMMENRREHRKIDVVAIFVCLQLKSAPQCVTPPTKRWAAEKLCSATLNSLIHLLVQLNIVRHGNNWKVEAGIGQRKSAILFHD